MVEVLNIYTGLASLFQYNNDIMVMIWKNTERSIMNQVPLPYTHPIPSHGQLFSVMGRSVCDILYSNIFDKIDELNDIHNGL
jgi:hypothetical protein